MSEKFSSKEARSRLNKVAIDKRRMELRRQFEKSIPETRIRLFRRLRRRLHIHRMVEEKIAEEFGLTDNDLPSCNTKL